MEEEESVSNVSDELFDEKKQHMQLLSEPLVASSLKLVSGRLLARVSS